MGRLIIGIVVAVVTSGIPGFTQGNLGTQLAELMKLRSSVANPDTRTRVSATHRVWAIGLASEYSEVKLNALDLLREPVKSASDHIRMPAVYAIAEIANSTGDVEVKKRALSTLREPLQAGQLPIRNAAIDAVNFITRTSNHGEIALEAVKELGGPVRSGNNGVRIPAIHAVMRAVENTHNEAAYLAALDLLVDPLKSAALIGGMEVRMMAILAVERIGVEASEIRTKARAMGLMQTASEQGSWEPEAKSRAAEAAKKIEGTMK
ncbi:MAG TPA: hypothetical protein VE398_04845 [Acidobacteriota bacterium]|nr:hypothetical protein [Acidobacteriota bacterium]